MSSVRIEDKHILMTMLHQFKVRDDLLPGKILMDLQKPSSINIECVLK